MCGRESYENSRAWYSGESDSREMTVFGFSQDECGQKKRVARVPVRDDVHQTEEICFAVSGGY